MRGGVPVLKRRMRRPKALRQSVSKMPACMPSGPDAYAQSPVMTRASKYVPEAITTAFTSYTAPSLVVTDETCPSVRPMEITIACLRSKFSCRSSVCFMSS